MEVSDVKREVTAALDRVKRNTAERRARNDQAAREYGAFLDRIAVPLFRQVAGVLKSEGHSFGVFTPGGSVRLAAESRSEDYIELTLDTTGDRPVVLGTSSRSRGSRTLTSERPLNRGSVAELTETEVLDYVTTELEQLLAR